jgi:hypothetical protein
MLRLGRFALSAALALATFTYISAPQVAHAAAGDTDTVMTVDGSTQYAMVADSANVELADTFTVELWVNPSDITSITQNFIVKENSYLFGMYNGDFAHALYGGGNWSWEDSGVKAAKDAWQHVAYVRPYRQNVIKIYVNAKLAYTGTANYLGTGSPANNASNVYFGERSYANDGVMAEKFTGKMDEIKIWNSERTAAQIQTDMNSWGASDYTNLKQYYDFNDVTGNSVANKVPSPPSGTTLTLVNAPSIGAVDSTTITAGKTIKTFPKSYLTSNGGYKIPSNVSNVEALLVAGGGGGGGYAWGGGGGAGGVVYDSNYPVTAGTFLPISVGGAGFAGRYIAAASADNHAGNGGDSWIGDSSFVAIGGGGGAGFANGLAATYSTGYAGGSSGGSSEQSTGSSITSPAKLQTTPSGATASYGNIGGAEPSGSYQAGSGGGGAGSVGGSTTTQYVGASGGDGLYFALTDSASVGVLSNSHYYIAGGGGGGGNTSVGTVSAGGGLGARAAATGNSGKPLTGGGGGGAYWSVGGSGGSGVVILAYVNYFGTSVSISVDPKKTTKAAGATAIVANTTSTGTVTFFANGRVINGCKSVAVSGTSATCNWKPITHGQVILTATYSSNDAAYAGSASAPSLVTTVTKRNTAR